MPDVELTQEHEVCPVVGFDEVVVVAVGEAGEEVGGEAMVVAADVSDARAPVQEEMPTLRFLANRLCCVQRNVGLHVNGPQCSWVKCDLIHDADEWLGEGVAATVVFTRPTNAQAARTIDVGALKIGDVSIAWRCPTGRRSSIAG